MSSDIRIIPVPGITELPEIVEGEDEARERRRHWREMLLLNVATGLSLVLVSCAWILLAFA